MPFGAEVSWEIIRQMQGDEMISVSSALSFSHTMFFITAIFILLIVLTCGPLLPVWMFINSMQLIAHVPLFNIRLPGNAHSFLLKHLEFINFRDLSESLGLLSLLDSKQRDAELVLNDDASYYTTLVHSCGYSHSFLPNLILCLSFFGLICLA